MKKIKLDKNALLGGIVLENEKYQVVHMNLKTGNQTDSYSNCLLYTSDAADE